MGKSYSHNSFISAYKNQRFSVKWSNSPKSQTTTAGRVLCQSQLYRRVTLKLAGRRLYGLVRPKLSFVPIELNTMLHCTSSRTHHPRRDSWYTCCGDASLRRALEGQRVKWVLQNIKKSWRINLTQVCEAPASLGEDLFSSRTMSPSTKPKLHRNGSHTTTLMSWSGPVRVEKGVRVSWCAKLIQISSQRLMVVTAFSFFNVSIPCCWYLNWI